MRQIEGRRAVSEALRAGNPISEILIFGKGDALDSIRRLAESKGVPVRSVPRSEIESVAETASPQGVIAMAGAATYVDLARLKSEARKRPPALFVALDGVTDPQNLGAVARTAEAAGAHGLIIPERRAAGTGPAAMKASAGALAWLPVARVKNLGRALQDLQEAGVWVVALAGETDTDIADCNLLDADVCLVIGAEGAGVSRLVLEKADAVCKIPMFGKVASLNASAAAAVSLYEVVRKRHG